MIEKRRKPRTAILGGQLDEEGSAMYAEKKQPVKLEEMW